MTYLKDGIPVQASALTISTPQNIAFDEHGTPNTLHHHHHHRYDMNLLWHCSNEGKQHLTVTTSCTIR